MIRRVGLWDHGIGLALCVAYVALLLATSLDVGMSRDEGFYTIAADRYGAWFEQLFEDSDAALEREAVERAWSYNHEHPSLVKSMFGCCCAVLLQAAATTIDANAIENFFIVPSSPSRDRSRPGPASPEETSESAHRCTSESKCCAADTTGRALARRHHDRSHVT